MLIKKLTALALVLVGAAVCFGQAAKNVPDLNGNWKLSKADGAKVFADKKPRFSDMTLKIVADSAMIRVERITYDTSASPQTEIFTYYSDGRGESNPTLPMLWRAGQLPVFQPDAFLSNTFWKENRLITSFDRTKGLKNSNDKHEWRLSKDGKKLILTSWKMQQGLYGTLGESFSSFERTKTKYVFERVN